MQVALTYKLNYYFGIIFIFKNAEKNSLILPKEHFVLKLAYIYTIDLKKYILTIVDIFNFLLFEILKLG